MAEVEMAESLYEFNQNIIKQMPIIEDEETKSKVRDILESYLEETPAEQYLMMLCREKHDYTLFNFYDQWDFAQFSEDVFICFENRGLGIIDCRIINDGEALEIWVKEPGQMETAYMYYIFPADQLVIEY